MNDKNNISFERIIRTEPRKMTFYQVHDYHELYFLEKGKTTYLLENKFYFLESGTIFFVPKGVFHKTENMDSPYIERSILYFDDTHIFQETASFINDLSAQNVFHINKEHLPEVENLFSLIEKESNSSERGNQALCQLYLSELLIKLLRYSATDIAYQPKGSNLFIKNITKYIRSNYIHDISLQHISKKFSISPSYLSRLFKQQTGINITEYITIVKITAAKKLLLNSNKSIAEIANACGFHDSNYFASVFKKFEKITPKKYALLHKK